MADPARRLSLKDALAARGVVRGAPTPAGAPRWDRATLTGRLTELSGHGATATLTLAFALVLDAQRAGETAAWVTGRRSTFFPPDAADAGVDLEALPVVRLPEVSCVPRAAERLLRSGAFGLVVLDLEDAPPNAVPPALQGRLLGLAERHDAAVVLLTEKPDTAPSVSSLVSLRAAARRRRTGDGRFLCEVEALKDKRRAPGWTHVEACHGPPGLR